MKNRFSAFAAASLIALCVSASAFAQTATDPASPRVNEVDQRLQNQQNRVNAGVASGQISAAQAAKDSTRDSKIAAQVSRDEAKHNGHITKREQRRLNKELNKNSKRIHKQRAQ
jgi:hypothetical protein